MKDEIFEAEINNMDKGSSLDIIKFLRSVIRYWSYFLISLIIALIAGYLYLRYAPIVYTSVTKIKIIDDSSETDIAKDPLSLVWSDSKINMDNEIAVIQSYRLLSQVVDSLDLNVAYYYKGSIKSAEIWDAPFIVNQIIDIDSISRPLSFKIELEVSGFKITDEDNETYEIPYFTEHSLNTTLPFTIELAEETKVTEFKHKEYLVMLYPFKETVENLTKSLFIQTLNKKSEILEIYLFGESPLKSETVLNKIVEAFNYDGIKDRQLVSKRTLEFIDERFGYLTQELDSIEGGKQSFKIQNNLSYIQEDAGNSLTRKSETETDVNNLETQISLAKVLEQTIVRQAEYMLLPVNIGLENGSLNALVENYNEMALERERLLASVGESHPTLVAISSQLERAKVNILKTVSVYEKQLQTSLGRLNQEKNKANSIFSELPEKEKRLRAIERQQSIKENLFLLLLQKREEAAISLAITAPSVKIVDYGLTDAKPISPKKMMIMGVAGLVGLLLPFLFFYIKWSMDNSIHDSSDFNNSSTKIPLLAEIPHFKDERVLVDINDRSVLGESFRILANNIKYMLPKNKSLSEQVIYVTSADMGEGKSLIAHNLAVAFTSMNKKVLLVGADLRSPQLHTFFFKGRSTLGLTDYLQNSSLDLNDVIFYGLENSDALSVCLSGNIPHNAPQLLANQNFESFITLVKAKFDIVIVDTAPTEPVIDTFLISDCADVTLYVARAGYTDKKVLETSNNLRNQNKLENMAYVLNDVHAINTKSYRYGYGDI
ncbi:GumC family protein [Maribacter aquivivus]|uniref:GumC family protein n=1 Tax=Maribacter aquivivus TaxID=228958 RepID=UPI002491F020|nr:polysaccharide biosynthesis tyrosine autokinase [Maribacter aquivivus]